MVGQSRQLDGQSIPRVLAKLEDMPGGGTPLCGHLQEIAGEVSSIASQLRDAGKRAAIIIMTDGEATDGDVSAVMKIFRTLPVFIVVRLCTGKGRFDLCVSE
jgi:Mg-chelatase subunit ChlD